MFCKQAVASSTIRGSNITELGTKVQGRGKMAKDKTIRANMAEQLQTKAADVTKTDPVPGPTAKAKANPNKKKAGTCASVL